MSTSPEVMAVRTILVGPSWILFSTGSPACSSTCTIILPRSAPSVSIFEATTILSPAASALPAAAATPSITPARIPQNLLAIGISLILLRSSEKRLQVRYWPELQNRISQPARLWLGLISTHSIEFYLDAVLLFHASGRGCHRSSWQRDISAGIPAIVLADAMYGGRRGATSLRPAHSGRAADNSP